MTFEEAFPRADGSRLRPTVVQSQPLPMTSEEVAARGWDEVDIVFVTGDAYIDHPSFATGLLARLLEADGFRVAILSQPDWQSPKPWATFGRPRLGFCVSAGNLDSMINHYTAGRKVRNEDAYSPMGKSGLRPDRATLTYCQRAREAWPGVNIIAGGVEASLRRLAHYDYWSDKVRRSVLLDSKASLLGYGMGESAILEIFRRLDAGEDINELRNIRGTVYRLGKTEDLPEETETVKHLPSCEEVSSDKALFAEMTRIAYLNLNPWSAKTLVQEHCEEAIVVNPPALPLSTKQLDAVYALPFTRLPHPAYKNKKIPAFEMIRDSVTILRGCFGGCAFCSLTAHQGKFVQSRSEESILTEIKQIVSDPERKVGTITDIGGPTANMYRQGCRVQERKEKCKRLSCLHPAICPYLNTNHDSLIALMRKGRELPGVENLLVASGVRTDLALESPQYIEELVRYHVGGHLKTAPEHTDSVVLDLMQKPPIEKYEAFCDQFAAACEMNQKELYLVPYLIAGLPGCDLGAMVTMAEYLHRNEIRPQQVQDFIPAPFELASCIYHTEINPLTGEKVYVPKGLRARRLQRALLFYYHPDYYHDVKSALKEAHREDLIGTGPECLIPPYPTKSQNMQRTSRVKRLIRKTKEDQDERKERRDTFRAAELEKKRAGTRPRRPSSGGSRPFGDRSPRRPADGNRSFGAPRGDRRRDDNRGSEQRSERSYQDRPPRRPSDDNRSFGAPQGDRRRDDNRGSEQRSERSYQDRPPRRPADDNRSFGAPRGDRRRDDNRGGGERSERSYQDRPPRRPSGDNRSFGAPQGDQRRDDNRGGGERSERSYQDRPPRRPSEGNRSFGAPQGDRRRDDNRGGGERSERSYQDRPPRRPSEGNRSFGAPQGDRRRDDNRGGGERSERSYQDRPPRRPSDDNRSFGAPQGDRRRDEGNKPYDKPSEGKRPYGSKPPHGGRPSGNSNRPGGGRSNPGPNRRPSR